MVPQAETAFRQALRLCPVSPEANYRLAKMYEDHGRIGDAIKVLKAYLEICPSADRVNAEKHLEQLEVRGVTGL